MINKKELALTCAQRTEKSAATTMMTERATGRQDSLEATTGDNQTLSFTSGMEVVEENALNITEESKENVQETLESWRDDEAPQEVSSDAIPSALSAPEAAPSVTPARKNELLLRARADRISWIQAVPLPYEMNVAPSTDNDPWSQDERLALLKDSNAVQSLPCIPQVLTSLYGMEQGSSVDMADRIQTVVSFDLCCPCFPL